MSENQVSTAHPYMANSVAGIKQAMLDAVGAGSIEELFVQIPAAHRMKGPLALPPGMKSEAELRRHLLGLLARNQSCETHLSFLGAGCWQHHVPAACEEVVRRREFLTSVFGSPASDHGRNQAWFEFTSQLGELVDCDLVGLPVYSWGAAAGHAVRMAERLTGRRRVLVPRNIDPERLGVMRTMAEPAQMPHHIEVTELAWDPATGGLDMAALDEALTDEIAAVYFDVPAFLGGIEPNAAAIARKAKAKGAKVIVGVDPISLGIVAPPGAYGADIVVGTLQTLGIPMNCGGGVGGFIASRDEEKLARQYPTLFASIALTVQPGERGFALSLFHQSSYGSREKGRDWTGNSVYLWGIANAVYMGLMGPEGFSEVGELIIARAHYAAGRLARVPGVRVKWPKGFFKEFVVDFAGTGRTVAEINAGLRRHGIFGGKDLSADFPELGQAALYCVTEIHNQADIDRLAEALEEVVR